VSHSQRQKWCIVTLQKTVDDVDNNDDAVPDLE